MVKEWSCDDTVTRFQYWFRDIHSWFLRLWIGSGRQEGFGIRQHQCRCIDTIELEMRSATGSEAHPALFIDLRGGIPTRRTRFLVDDL